MSQVERYALGEPIARGGMGTVHLGRLVGSAGFARTVAIKRIHQHLLSERSLVDAFTAEAHLAARIRHPNVVPTLDVVEHADAGVLLVMEYVDGESLAALLKASSERVPLPVAIAIVCGMLHGLHSAHEARSEAGAALEIVHRDVSPQNVLVGADGVARLVDFGIARAANEAGTTAEGDIKGKLAYMAPEQIRRERTTRRIDVFAAGIVLWELLTGQRLFHAEHPGATLEKILVGWVPPPSSVVRELSPALDEIALRALDPEPANRFQTAREMATALEDAMRPALGREVAAWVEARAGKGLVHRREAVARFEKGDRAPARRLPSQPIEETATRLIETVEDETSVQGLVVAPTTAPRARRSVALPVALLTLGVAITVLVNASRPAATFHPQFSVQPPSTPTFVAMVAPAAPPATSASAPAAPVEPARTEPARPKRAFVASPRPRRAPCIAKVDPATQKRVYQGDCD